MVLKRRGREVPASGVLHAAACPAVAVHGVVAKGPESEDT